MVMKTSFEPLLRLALSILATAIGGVSAREGLAQSKKADLVYEKANLWRGRP